MNPLLLVVSHEEGRVIREVVEIAGDKSKVMIWSLTGALVDEKREEVHENVDDPVSLLDFVEAQKAPTIFVLKDFLQFLSGSQGYVVERKLRDCVGKMSGDVRIVMVDSTSEIPRRLSKIVTVVDLPLPSQGELEAVARQILTDSKSFHLVEGRDEIVKRVADAARGLTLHETENAVACAIVDSKGVIDADALRRSVSGEKKQLVAKTSLEFHDSTDGMSSVGGLDVLIDWVGKRGKAYSDEAQKWGVPKPKGMLLLGMPGCGKTLVGRAVGNAWGVPVLTMEMGSMMNKYVGESEGRMREALKTASAIAPCVLFIDEVDKGVSSGESGDSGTSSRMLQNLLTWMNDDDSGVFVIMTANDPRNLPQELTRAGRLDARWYVGFPNAEEREQILRIHLKKARVDSDVYETSSIEELVEKMNGFSGSEIEQCVKNAMYDCFDDGPRPVGKADLLFAAHGVYPMSAELGERLKAVEKWAKKNARMASTPSSVSRSRRRAV